MNDIQLSVLLPLTIILSITIGGVLVLLISKKIAIWIEAVKTVKAVAMFQKEIQKLQKELEQNERTINQLRRKNELLEQQVRQEKTLNTEQKHIIEKLSASLDERDKIIATHVVEFKKSQTHQKEFEKSLFKALTLMPGVDPNQLDVAWGNWEE